jgi:hypothetical protein
LRGSSGLGKDAGVVNTTLPFLDTHIIDEQRKARGSSLELLEPRRKVGGWVVWVEVLGGEVKGKRKPDSKCK